MKIAATWCIPQTKPLACAIAQADWLVLDQQAAGRARNTIAVQPCFNTFQHVLTCFNIISCRVLETF